MNTSFPKKSGLSPTNTGEIEGGVGVGGAASVEVSVAREDDIALVLSTSERERSKLLSAVCRRRVKVGVAGEGEIVELKAKAGGKNFDYKIGASVGVSVGGYGELVISLEGLTGDIIHDIAGRIVLVGLQKVTWTESNPMLPLLKKLLSQAIEFESQKSFGLADERIGLGAGLFFEIEAKGGTVYDHPILSLSNLVLSGTSIQKPSFDLSLFQPALSASSSLKAQGRCGVILSPQGPFSILAHALLSGQTNLDTFLPFLGDLENLLKKDVEIELTFRQDYQSISAFQKGDWQKVTLALTLSRNCWASLNTAHTIASKVDGGKLFNFLAVLQELKPDSQFKRYLEDSDVDKLTFEFPLTKEDIKEWGKKDPVLVNAAINRLLNRSKLDSTIFEYLAEQYQVFQGFPVNCTILATESTSDTYELKILGNGGKFSMFQDFRYKIAEGIMEIGIKPNFRGEYYERPPDVSVREYVHKFVGGMISRIIRGSYTISGDISWREVIIAGATITYSDGTISGKGTVTFAGVNFDVSFKIDPSSGAITYLRGSRRFDKSGLSIRIVGLKLSVSVWGDVSLGLRDGNVSAIFEGSVKSEVAVKGKGWKKEKSIKDVTVTKDGKIKIPVPYPCWRGVCTKSKKIKILS